MASSYPFKKEKKAKSKTYALFQVEVFNRDSKHWTSGMNST